MSHLASVLCMYKYICVQMYAAEAYEAEDLNDVVHVVCPNMCTADYLTGHGIHILYIVLCHK